MSTARMTWLSLVGLRSPRERRAGATAVASAEESALVQALAMGSGEAFSEIYRQHGRRVFQVAYQHAASYEIAEEVAQETFLLLLREPGKFQPERGALGAFLSGVARHLARRARTGTNRARGEEWDDALLPGQEVSGDALQEIMARQEWNLLHQSVATLPEPYRETLVMHHLEGLPYEEIAQALGCPVGTVRSRLARAREMLARKLASLRKEAPPAAEAKAERHGKGGTEDGTAK